MLNAQQNLQLKGLLDTVEELTADSISEWHHTLADEVKWAADQIRQITVATNRAALVQDMVKTFDERQQSVLKTLEGPIRAIAKLVESGHLSDAQKTKLLIRLGKTHDLLTQWDIALDQFSQALDYCQDDLSQKAEVLRSVGRTKTRQRDYRESSKQYRASLAISSQLQDLYHVAQIYISLGWNEFQCHNYPEAKANYEKALEIAKTTEGTERLIADVYSNQAILATVHGDFEEALSNYEKSIHSYTAIDDVRGLAMGYYNMGMLYTDMGALQQAGESYQKSIDYAEAQGNLLLMGHIYLSYTELTLKMSDLELAQACCMHAVKVFGRLGSQSPMSEAYKYAALVQYRRQNLDKASRFFQRSLQLAQESGSRLNLAEAHYEYGLMLMDRRDLDSAKNELDEALNLFTVLEAKADVEKTRQALERLGDSETETTSGKRFKRIRRG